MDCTRQTRVEGVNGAQEFKWTIWIHNGRLKERSRYRPHAGRVRLVDPHST